ncbi:MAG: dihydroorotase [Candidatus Pacebacteria bacterium]|nr:dihydroorotase [Candidatus Paceibacterota bacterium]
MSINNANEIIIPRWFDRHLHLREWEMLRQVLPCTLRQQATGAVIMPNLTDPITTIEKAQAYKKAILDLSPPDSGFVPCLTLYLTDQTDPEEVVRGFQMGAWRAVKLYMTSQAGQGGTTGSAHGVRDLFGRYKVLEVMEKHGIPLLGHFEAVEAEVDEFDREVVSLCRDLIPLLKAFPNLPVVFEHVTDSRVADLVASGEYENLYATVTAHHLLLNRNDMFSGGMTPLHYCKPVPKREEHRQVIRQYVTSGHWRFGAGTDSAPHDVSRKSRCVGCAAGIFTAPIAVELYATVFDEDNALQHLGAFLSKNFLSIYGMKVSKEMMLLQRQDCEIPEGIGNIRVFRGGTKLPWKLCT